MLSSEERTTMSTETVAARPRSYWNLWRTLPKELVYLFIAFPVSVVGFVITIGLFWAGIGTLVTFFLGVIFLIAALYVSRGFGTVDLALLEWAGRPRIPRPDWLDARARTGFFGWLRAVIGNGHYWLYLLYVMVVDFIITIITWTITITWVAVGLGGISYWFWDGFIPNGDRDFYVSSWLFDRIGVDVATPGLIDNLLNLLVGVLFLFTLPFVTRGLTSLHWAVARGILAAFKSDALRREVEDLSRSRGAAISAEGHSLRRLERDIHDGPQQRLVRLQMDLAAAERQLDTDPDKARDLISEAMQQSKDALEELRALSRGFAPPILLDRGLVAALESAAVRSTTPARVVSELPEGVELPQEIERNAYFIASEALMNAARHASATDIEVRVSQRVTQDATWLDVTVTDNGTGGAHATPGHGIAGLEERLRGLGGTLEVLSPAGGPTVVAAHLPVVTAVPSAAPPSGPSAGPEVTP